MEAYTYSPLDLDEPTFRLIRLFSGIGRLQCELVHALLAPSHIMDYEAVSYTWGNATDKTYIEIHNETIKRLRIWSNLYDLLLDLRDSVQDRMLWIDAICINQDAKDETERNHQVQQMAEIYRQARGVIVWLGSSTNETNLAMESLIGLQTLCKNMKLKPNEIHASTTSKGPQSDRRRDHEDPQSLGIKQIFDRPWFCRIWILQEVGNARTALIHCGRKAVSSIIFSVAPLIFNIEIDSHCQAVLDLMPGSPARSTQGIQYRDLRTLLLYFREAQAARQHDHIYALLGLCSEESKRIKVSYEKHISTVISDVISQICHYEVAPGPLYYSIEEFQDDIEHLDEMVMERVIVRGYTDSLRSVFERGDVNINFAKDDMLTTAVKNEEKGKQPTITEAMFTAAIRNTVQGKELLEILLRQRQDCVGSERDKILARAIRKVGKRRTLFNVILQRAGKQVISDRVLELAIRQCSRSEEYIDIALQRDRELAITEAMVMAVVQSNGEVLHLMLQRAKNCAIAPGVLSAAIGNEDENGIRSSSVFSSDDNYPITVNGMIATINEMNQNRDDLYFLFRNLDISAITANIVISVIEIGIEKREVLRFLFERGDDSAITPRILQLAIDILNDNREVLRAIFPQANKITTDVVIAAIKNTVH
ncbi:heterokaryon incompatibility protein-domain-containing protein [Xylaria cf. heliscus]|nr:heterokaryon incompatibility protein-domain-containing protein [Xylaria cf. heliscus]